MVRSCRACTGGLPKCLGGGRGRLGRRAVGSAALQEDIWGTDFFGQVRRVTVPRLRRGRARLQGGSSAMRQSGGLAGWGAYGRPAGVSSLGCGKALASTWGCQQARNQCSSVPGDVLDCKKRAFNDGSRKRPTYHRGKLSTGTTHRLGPESTSALFRRVHCDSSAPWPSSHHLHQAEAGCK